MKSFHPVSIFVFFASVIFSLMLVSNPIYTAVSLAGALLTLFMCRHGERLLRELLGYFAVFVLISLMNPLFVHRGSTPLLFINGRAVTLEAVLYGINSAAQLVTAIIWCRGFSLVITNDRLFCLVGKLSPKIAAMLMMTVRFIPDLITQGRKIGEYSRMTGRYDETSFIGKIKRLMGIFSALVTWAIENGIQIADSMSARGFELGGRTSYTVYRFCGRDLLLTLVCAGSAAASALMRSGINPEFYPTVVFPEAGLRLLAVSLLTAVSFMIPSVRAFYVDARRKKYGREESCSEAA